MFLNGPGQITARDGAQRVEVSFGYLVFRPSVHFPATSRNGILCESMKRTATHRGDGGGFKVEAVGLARFISGRIGIEILLQRGLVILDGNMRRFATYGAV